MVNIEFIDWWSLWHFIFGMIVCFLSWKIVRSKNSIVIITLSYIVFIGWELLEAFILSIYVSEDLFGESLLNKIGDIIFDTLGFLIIFTYLRLKRLKEGE